MEIRFHLDEHIDPAIAAGLRRRGIDVTTTIEAGLRLNTDEAQLAFARSERRVVVTCDADFLVLHSQGLAHAGIVFCPRGLRTIGHVLRALVLVHDCLSAEDMERHVEYL